MNNKSVAVYVVVAGLVIIALYYLYQQKNKEIKELREAIDNDKQLNTQIRNRLIELLNSNKDIDPDIANELTSICALLEIKQETKALLSLTKIIEKLLKRLYKTDSEFISKYKRPSLSDYLSYAREKNVISNEDYHLLSVLRLIRNEEAHELNVHKDESKITAAFVSGISFVLTLNKMIRKSVTTFA